ncbi:HTH-type transcriptional repressor PurR [bioreactor metagenome]|uniref:HTH-type transcriptional repressor PurR n=1 Tax=bioreactor metagenome TaxID=1076179 RepID=A0A645E4K6_9ZZZZ
MLTAQLVRSLSREGAQVEIIPTAELDVFQDKFFQGAISLLYRPDHLEELSRLCRSSRLPLVSINCDFDGYPAVCSDDRQGIGLAIDFLAERGHREFAFIGKSLPTASQENRQRFFCEHLAEHGFPPGLVLRIPDAEHMIESVLKLLRRTVTAVIVTHEDYGLAVSYALALAGKRVPDDLSLIAYESAGISRFCLPAQTTIRQDFEQLANGAIELLHSDAGEGRRLLLPYTLIERDSVGRPPL